MKTLSNSRGISLVVLVVAMTLIAILGASFVSLMGSKQKGFLYQTDSYKAFNIANAGVEYAIRYASDGLDNNGDSIFFTDNDLSTLGKSFGGGTFSINYAYSTNILTVIGTYNNDSSRKIQLANFRRYLSPITLVPDGSTLPSRNANQVTIPVINNNESTSITVNQINLIVSESGKHLQQIKISNYVTPLFDFASSTFTTCGSPPCIDSYGLLLPSGVAVSFNSVNGLSSHSINQDDIVTYTLVFYETTAPTGQYTFKPSVVSPAVEPTLIFTPP